MDKSPKINAQKMLTEAQTSKHKETYKLLDRTNTVRIGVGARSSSKTPSFFIEVIIQMSQKSSKVNTLHLEKTIECIRTLQSRGYSLTQDDNCIAGEITNSLNPSMATQILINEYETIRKIISKIFE